MNALAKLATAFAVVVFVARTSPAADVYSFWLPNGTGGWSSDERWENGAPSTTRNAVIKDCDGWATDEDFAVMTGLTRIRLRGAAATLDMRFDENHEGDFNTLMKDNTDSSTKARLIKSGAGTFTHTSGRNGFFVDEYFVTNGTLKIGFVETKITNTIYGAFAPGDLVLTSNAAGSSRYIKGLTGDGTISATASTKLNFVGDQFHDWMDDSPIVFSGTLGANVNPTIQAGRHHFTGYTTEDLTIRLYGGEVGVGQIGRFGGGGSLGKDHFNFLGNGVRFLYLGEGETTDKSFKFVGPVTNGTVDAGAHGGVTFGAVWTGGDLASPFTVTLDGSNTAACVIAGNVADCSTNDDYAVNFRKCGSGTWRFATRARGEMHGTVSVEDGVLEYDSLSNANVACSLGLATRLPEGWAMSLGGNSTTGILSYVGSDDAICDTRPIALKGAGVVRASTSAPYLHFSGATATGTDGGTLILDGEGENDNFGNVTNGTGSVAVVKRGAGTWTLGGDIALAGGVDVQGGTLRILSQGVPYKWYRYTVKRLWSDSNNQLQLSQLGLFAATGTSQSDMQQNIGLTGDAKYVDDQFVVSENRGRAYRIDPGEVVWNHSHTYYSSSGTYSRFIDSLFKGNANGLYNGWRKSGSSGCLNPNKPETWMSFTMRLQDDAKPVCYYDVKSQQGYKEGKMYEREPRQWMLEGSIDGCNWDWLDERKDITLRNGSAIWYSSDNATFNPQKPGFAITPCPTNRTVEVASVKVTGRAKLLVEGDPLPVSTLVADFADGGTVSNVAFAATGTLEIPGLGKWSGELPLKFEGVSGLSNVGEWTLTSGGVPVQKSHISVSGNKISILRDGLILLFR